MKVITSISLFFILIAAPSASSAVPSTGYASVLPGVQHVAQSIQTANQYHSGHEHLEGQICGTDFSSDEARAVMAQIASDRRAGLYELARTTASKGSSPPDIGDVQTFNVVETAWMPLEFQLVDTTNLYYLWVEVAELSNGNVQPGEITQFRDVIHDETPARSIDPNKGIFANNHDIFGLPPDIDGDGIVDILMYDIGRGTGSVIGYVSGSDQLLDPPDGVGNERDVLYLDSDQGTRNFTTLAAIAAHEYTHLINLSYGWDGTFVTEGYAEYAMVMNGYYWRNISYVSSNFEVSKPLFDWRTSGQVTLDYERGGLFFTYISEQTSAQVIGQMMKDREKKGALGLDSVLVMNGSSLSDMILDFHTANYLNDQSVETRFGYNEPERSMHNAFLSSQPVNGELTNPGGEGGFTLQFAETINAGAVHYFRVTNVSDFVYTYDTPSPIPIFKPDKLLRNRARVLIDHEDGSFSTMEIEPGEDQHLLQGEFDALTFVFVHENPSIAIGDQQSLEAGWIPLSTVTDTDDFAVLPTVSGISGSYPNPFSGITKIPVSLSRSGFMRLEVFDMLGRSIQLLADDTFPAGEHLFQLDGSSLVAGSYLVRMITEEGVRAEIVTRAK